MELEHSRPVWLEIDLDKAAYNYQSLRGYLNENSKLLAVVKGNAYGHVAVEMAKAFFEFGVDMLGVAMVSEGVELRKAGITGPILVMGQVAKSQMPLVIKYDLTQGIFNYDDAKELSKLAIEANKTVTLHVKIDSGMSRIGFVPSEQAINDISAIFELPNLNVEGIFTHFATADEEDKTFTKKQFSNFKWVVQKLKEKNIEFEIEHVANGPAMLDIPEYSLDMVRIGVMLYGYFDSEEVHQERIDIKKIMSLKARISNVKSVPKGTGVSYGQTFHTSRETIIATIPLGYADGFPRTLSNKGYVLVNSKRAPIIGRICMDQMMIDVTDCGEVNIDDTVGIYGIDHENCMQIEQIVTLANSLHAEIISNMSRRLPRVYIKNSKFSHIVDYLLD